MSSKTVALQRTTYERLKAARLPGESFTDAVNRLLAGKEPRLTDLAHLFDPKAAAQIAASIEEMRAAEIRYERSKLRRRR